RARAAAGECNPPRAARSALRRPCAAVGGVLRPGGRRRAAGVLDPDSQPAVLLAQGDRRRAPALPQHRRRAAPSAGDVGGKVAAGALALAPALAFDARVLASPGTARYAGDDDWQFVAGWPAGTGLPKFAHELERRAPPGESIVASVVIPWGLVVRFDHPRLVP